MADLSTSFRFGSNIAFNETTKVLSIDLNDLTDSGDFTNGYGLDISGLTAANLDSYASKILWSLLLLSEQNQSENNNDETVGIYITNGGKRSVIRNGVAQFGYVFTVTAYRSDSLGVVLDPDDIGS